MAEELTAIIVALLGGDALDRSVEAAASQARRVIVVHRDGTIVDQHNKALGNAGRLDIPGKRKAAIALAATEVVGLLEDTVLPGSDWSSAAVSACARKAVVASAGPVEVAKSLPAASRSLALSEYGAFNHPDLTTAPTVLPGCNMAFRRSAVLEAMQETDGLVDQVVFRNLLAAGGEFTWSPGMSVTFAHANPAGARLATRFDHGRLYASTEAWNSGAAGRLIRAGKALLLPPVLFARGLQNATAGDWKSPATLGWLALQQTAWAAGEFVGATMGPSRKGMAQWQ